MQKSRILVVDDDCQILKLLSRYLEGQGFDVRQASSLSQMQARLERETVDLVVLDIMLPDGSGLDACIDLRRQGNRTPVILLTAMREDVDRIMGLEMGADDYMGKPFVPRELAARIKAVLRRTTGTDKFGADQGTRFVFADFTVDTTARTVTSNAGDIQLTGAEFEILRFFLEHPGRVISRDQIMDATNREGLSADRSIDVLMSRIRRKFRDEGCTEELFKTVRNGGYQFAVQVDRVK